MKRHALLIGINEYQDSTITKLIAPIQDVVRLGSVLKNPQIGNFSVATHTNSHIAAIKESIEEFLIDRQSDETVLLYFSGHGIKDFYDGQLYLAVTNTKINRLESTAISSEFINKLILKSPASQRIIILDCCYSGAFKKGMKIKAGTTNINTAGYFSSNDGKGLALITASDSMQYSLEENEVGGKSTLSKFTRILVDGMESGNADLDKDGQIELNELYEYAYNLISTEPTSQKPDKAFSYNGKIIIASSNISSSSQKTNKLSNVLSPSLRLSHPLDLDFTLVPKGNFVMGTVDEKPQSFLQSLKENSIFHSTDKPAHTVFTSEYYISTNPVSVGQFLVFVNNTGYSTWAEKKRIGHVYGQHYTAVSRTGAEILKWQYRRNDKANWQNPTGENNNTVNSEEPVTQILWEDAYEFCRWLSNSFASKVLPIGWTFRLPTESEWEKSAKQEYISSANELREWCLDGWDERVYKYRENQLVRDPFVTPNGGRVTRGEGTTNRLGGNTLGIERATPNNKTGFRICASPIQHLTY